MIAPWREASDAGRLSVHLVQNSTLKSYPGFGHGMLTVDAEGRWSRQNDATFEQALRPEDLVEGIYDLLDTPLPVENAAL